MRVVNIAAEMAPIAKVGGLGDVVGGLTSELVRKGIDAIVILPKYKNLKTSFLKDLKVYKKNFQIFEKRRWQKTTIYSAKLNRVQIYLIEDNKNYFSKPNIYGYKGDVTRFLFFCKTALEFLKSENKKIDILHLHDWHTAIIAPLYKEIYSKDTLNVKKIVLSIHNLGYQGYLKPKDIDNLGFDGSYFLQDKKLKDPNRPKTLNLLKGGIIYSDLIVPVSKGYAKEIMLKENEKNLHKVIEQNKKKIKGIINGIDPKYWDPKTDKFLKHKLSCDLSIKKLIDQKKKNKKDLQKYLNLDQLDKPLICSIGRLVPQKGPSLIKASLMTALKNNAQFALLGSVFDKKTTKEFYKLKNDLKNNKNVSILFEHNEKLAHLIFAAADFVMIPSLFEPCGLTQMIAFKYGAVPIVRKTGGLADTVFDLDDRKIIKTKRNGFSFDKFSETQVEKATKRALNFWQMKNQDFYMLVKKNMKLNFSWENSAKKYLKAYKNLLS
ncbi:MAG: Glycogen synthase [Candidatus Anoxychlamydiales bacterium]|nr:Glycogen synthase [Candidatus Anoxychlamydiales bacterium]